ncbi:ace4dc57-dd88-4b7b-b07b-57dc313a7ec7 [Thermothielavioides terrestris]|uniref:Ace4dc57-dd88-4b7b-b07b-57dc313a7ec7 n=1 Tax=Thermothielavioides terrestris TaxID=2587410 RepID=A0A3S4BLC0_9PEZI|nr:ace4dc57-dd88-4b7b-b07b-57dc313a7ec7 [Thermothielavioides terrestris]
MALTAALALAALLPAAAGETVLGVYIFHRHGDRTAKEWPPTSLTALGTEQVLSSGTYYRNRYIGANASSPIAGVSHDLAVLSQLSVSAPVDSVLQNSAQAFLQGLYPPAGSVATQKLANGTDTNPPLGGYQYIPVNAVTSAASGSSSENSVWLQGTSGCGNAMISSNEYYTSTEYLDTLASTADFYKSLEPVINGTFTEAQASFKNAYAIYDLIHVATIHNSTIPSSSLLTPETLHQLQTRADQHEWGLAYNSSSPIRAVSGAVLAAQIVQSLNSTLQTASAASGLKLGIQFGAYGTFMSFFGLAQLPAVSADFTGMVDYASSFAVELVTNSTAARPAAADVAVRFLFSNGSAGLNAAGLQPFPLFGRRETLLPWDTFASEMGKFAIGDTGAWCRACGNTTGVCADYAAGAAGAAGGDAGNGGGDGGVSRPVAGVIGAVVTLVVVLALEGLLMAVAGLRLTKKKAAFSTEAQADKLSTSSK